MITFKKELDVFRYIFRFYPQVPEGKFEIVATYGRIYLMVVTPECKIKKYLIIAVRWHELNAPKSFAIFTDKLDKAFIDAGYE